MYLLHARAVSRFSQFINFFRCNLNFGNDVLASMQHYEGVIHENKVRQYFVDGLIKLQVVKRLDKIPEPLENGVIKRGFNVSAIFFLYLNYWSGYYGQGECISGN